MRIRSAGDRLFRGSRIFQATSRSAHLQYNGHRGIPGGAALEKAIAAATIHEFLDQFNRLEGLMIRDGSRGAKVRVLRGTHSKPHHVRVLGALDGVARRPSLRTFDVLWPGRTDELPSPFTQGR
jgi:hypothetical protein